MQTAPQSSGWFGNIKQFIGIVDSVGNTVSGAFGKIVTARTQANNQKAAAEIARIRAQSAVDVVRARAARAKAANTQSSIPLPIRSLGITSNKGLWLGIAALLGVLLIIRRKQA